MDVCDRKSNDPSAEKGYVFGIFGKESKLAKMIEQGGDDSHHRVKHKCRRMKLRGMKQGSNGTVSNSSTAEDIKLREKAVMDWECSFYKFP
ncbi:hypothetical protein MUK42_32766 [Musa troglodytarum]|uniref:Uncharacterized protein n=1 Tax=Musa troglodytarum TaxID=320322 RepID=A0A9E7GA74_9LILI|nr:hypothetical protein MUK42_32766 [Musa troglodytarum]